MKFKINFLGASTRGINYLIFFSVEAPRLQWVGLKDPNKLIC